MYKIIILTAALFISANTSFAQTHVSGQIRNNTTWTKAGSPYICTGLIEVDTYSTLTIEPGVIVDLDKNIDVYGGIIFKHNNTDTTVIKSNGNKPTLPFIQIRNVNYTDSILLKYYDFFAAGIIIYWPKSTVVIEECNFNKSNVTWRPTGSQTFIFQNNKCTETNLHMSTKVLPPLVTGEAESVIINNNIFQNSGYQVINGEIDNKNNVEITNNTFKNCGVGIRLSASSGMLISDNVFSKSVTGILLWPQSKPVKIISNVFFENDEAISLAGIGDTFEIRNNSIYNNNVGVAINYYYQANYPPTPFINPPIITGNCIYDNKVSGIGWGATNDITIGANWWGTTNTSIIDSMIFDNKDDFKRGLITYQPFLTQNNPDCKTYTPPATTEELSVNRNQVQTYPNPFLNTLELKSNKLIKAVYLYNLVGKLVYQSQPNSNSISINTQEYATGVYLYRIMTDDNDIQTGKIIKQ